jgi:hypothetical protein
MMRAGFKVNVMIDKFCRLVSPEGQVVELIGFHSPRTPMWTHTFDFKHCALWMDEKDFADPFNVYSNMTKKQLVFNRSLALHQDSDLLLRLNKYLKLGFTISDEEMCFIQDSLFRIDYKSLPRSSYATIAKNKVDKTGTWFNAVRKWFWSVPWVLVWILGLIWTLIWFL